MPEWQIRQLGAFITWSGLEKIQNRGSQQAVDLMSTKEKHAIATLKNMFAASLYSDGTAYGSKEFSGLKLICANDPTAAGTVGGIDQWRILGGATSTARRLRPTRPTSSPRRTRWSLRPIAIPTPPIIICGATMLGLLRGNRCSRCSASPRPSRRMPGSPPTLKGKEVFYDYNCPTKACISWIRIACRSATPRIVGSTWATPRTVTNADYDVCADLGRGQPDL